MLRCRGGSEQVVMYRMLELIPGLIGRNLLKCQLCAPDAELPKWRMRLGDI